MESNKLKGFLVAGVLVVQLASPISSASADDNPKVSAGSEAMDIHASQASGGKQSSATTITPAGKTNAPVYEWRTACQVIKLIPTDNNPICGNQCPPDQVFMARWQVSPPPARKTFETTCMSPAEAAAAAVPQVTPGMVAEAFARLPMPTFKSEVQPANKTLVNFDTIFYTAARPFDRDISLLGQTVHLRVTPSKFTWHHGDGTTTTTQTAGAPYPNKDVVHRYQDAHTSVAHHVVITWTARWRLDNSGWQDVNGTATSTGPTSTLAIAEAVPVLSGNGH